MRLGALRVAGGVLLSLALVSGSFAQNASSPVTRDAPQSAGAPAASSAPTEPPRPARPMSDQPTVPGKRGRKGGALRSRGAARAGAPIATYPGFRVLEDGTTRVWVEVDRRVEVSAHKAQGRVAYRLAGAQAPTRTNRLPLLTGWFASPVGRIQLVDQGADVDLVIELRAAADATHKILETEGGMVLVVELPKVEGLKPAPPIAANPAAGPARRKRTTESTSIDGTGAY